MDIPSFEALKAEQLDLLRSQVTSQSDTLPHPTGDPELQALRTRLVSEVGLVLDGISRFSIKPDVNVCYSVAKRFHNGYNASKIKTVKGWELTRDQVRKVHITDHGDEYYYSQQGYILGKDRQFYLYEGKLDKRSQVQPIDLNGRSVDSSLLRGLRAGLARFAVKNGIR